MPSNGAKRTIAALAIAGVAAAGIAPGGEAHAQARGLPFPAPAGTEWEVVAGYNTVPHSGEDPYALDLVRANGPTEGTAVLAPVAGEVWAITSDSGCVIIRDAREMLILMCHLDPAPGLAEGDLVVTGETIATVAPAGAAENGGLAHIHLAVHRNFNAGEQQTVPFTGDYALEDRDLYPTGDENGYFGERFRSTIGSGSGDAPANPYAGPPRPDLPAAAPAPVAPTPQPSVPPAPTPAPSAPVSRLRVTSTGPYSEGPNSIVVQGGGAAGAVAAVIAAESGLEVEALWLLANGDWSYFLPSVPDAGGGLDSFPDRNLAVVAILS